MRLLNTTEGLICRRGMRGTKAKVQKYKSSELQRDSGDALIVRKYLLQGNLFDQTHHINIYTGKIFAKANVENANERGGVILTKIKG